MEVDVGGLALEQAGEWGKSGVQVIQELLLFNQIFRPFSGRPGAALSTENGLSSRVRKNIGSMGKALELDRMPPREVAGIEGRDKLIKRLFKLFFERNERHLKLHGPEGSGKTAVALEFIHECRDDFPGGVIWLNGSFIVWDTYRYLVEDLEMHSFSYKLDLEELRKQLWQTLFEKRKPWLLVIDDAADDGLEWIPPLAVSKKNGFVLVTSKSKSGVDEALRLELPLLSAKAATSIVLSFSDLDESSLSRAERHALQVWTDNSHLCRNTLGMRTLGLLSSLYDLTFEELLERYDCLAARTIMPDLMAILQRYKLDHYMENLRNNGVLDTLDFIRGQPWTSIEKLTRRERYQFERIQENLFRSRNRLSTKLLCKIWRDILKNPEISQGRDIWEMLRIASFMNCKYIPPSIISNEATAAGFEVSKDIEQGDLIYAGDDGSLCVHASLLEAVRSMSQKRVESNRNLAKRVLISLHAFCHENLFPSEVFVNQPDQRFRAMTLAMLPHIFIASGLCAELLLSSPNGSLTLLEDSDDQPDPTKSPSIESKRKTQGSRKFRSGIASTGRGEDLPEDFVLSKLPRRHSLFSVASGHSSMSSRSMRSSNGGSVSTSSMSGSEANTPLMNKFTRRFTSKSKKAGVPLMLADLNALQGFLLLLIPMGSFRINRAETFLVDSIRTYSKFEERAQVRATKYLLGHCHMLAGADDKAIEIWDDVLDTVMDGPQRLFVQTSISFLKSRESKGEQKVLADALERVEDGEFVSARGWVYLGEMRSDAGDVEGAKKAFEQALEVQEFLCPLTSVTAHTHILLAKLFLSQDASNEAMEHANEALSIFSSLGDANESELAGVYALLGYIYIERGDLKQAAKQFRRSIRHSDHSDKKTQELCNSFENEFRLRKLAESLAGASMAAEAQEAEVSAKAMRKQLRQWDMMFRQAVRDNSQNV